MKNAKSRTPDTFNDVACPVCNMPRRYRVHNGKAITDDGYNRMEKAFGGTSKFGPTVITSSTKVSVTVDGAGWKVDEHKGRMMTVYSADGEIDQRSRVIIGNTEDTLSLKGSLRYSLTRKAPADSETRDWDPIDPADYPQIEIVEMAEKPKIHNDGVLICEKCSTKYQVSLD